MDRDALDRTSPRHGGQRWALVLAAGEGSRLRHITVDHDGAPLPKQFWSLPGRPSLVREAVRRAARAVPGERIMAVVAAEHEPHWRRELAAFPQRNLVVQPENRGTAAGILLPLLTIAHRDPEAQVLILPSDHFVSDEEALTAAINAAMGELRSDDQRVLLLGITPDEADPELGYIVPGTADRAAEQARPVARFHEKPSPEIARALVAEGGLWNSFILVASARALLALVEARLPRLFEALILARLAEAGGARLALGDAYRSLPVNDFSRDVLQGAEARLGVVPVAGCGWSDLGTPERLARCLAARPRDLLPRSPQRFPAALARRSRPFAAQITAAA